MFCLVCLHMSIFISNSIFFSLCTLSSSDSIAASLEKFKRIIKFSNFFRKACKMEDSQHLQKFTDQKTKYFKLTDKNALWRWLSDAVMTKHWNIPLPTMAAFISKTLSISVVLFIICWVIASIFYFLAPTSAVPSAMCPKLSYAVSGGHPVLCICVHTEETLHLVRSSFGDVLS